MKYCPNCVTKMIKDKKKLGYRSTWLICPNCGLRDTDGSLDYVEQKKRDELSARISEDNMNGGFKDCEI